MKLSKCKNCLCLDCEKEFKTIIENCHCPTCIKEDWECLSYCKDYEELEEIRDSGIQQSLF